MSSVKFRGDIQAAYARLKKFAHRAPLRVVRHFRGWFGVQDVDDIWVTDEKEIILFATEHDAERFRVRAEILAREAYMSRDRTGRSSRTGSEQRPISVLAGEANETLRRIGNRGRRIAELADSIINDHISDGLWTENDTRILESFEAALSTNSMASLDASYEDCGKFLNQLHQIYLKLAHDMDK